MKLTRIFALTLVSALALGACNTVRGAGQDIERAGETIERAAD